MVITQYLAMDFPQSATTIEMAKKCKAILLSEFKSTCSSQVDGGMTGTVKNQGL